MSIDMRSVPDPKIKAMKMKTIKR